MGKAIFITGTGTDVGKTYVSALIVKKLVESGENCCYYKTAASGAEKIGEKLIAGDCKYVREIGGLNESAAIVSYVYERAVSPHLAAKLENRPLQMRTVKKDFISMKESFDYTVVEGSGGIVCPLRVDSEIIMLTDVIKKFALKIIIVADAGLGTINNTVLTAGYAKNNKLSVLGVILNNYDCDNFMHKDNAVMIEKLTNSKILAYVPKNAERLDIEINKLKSYFD